MLLYSNVFIKKKKMNLRKFFRLKSSIFRQSPLKAYFCVYDIFIPLGSLKIINSCFAVNVLIHRISRLTVLHGTWKKYRCTCPGFFYRDTVVKLQFRNFVKKLLHNGGFPDFIQRLASLQLLFVLRLLRNINLKWGLFVSSLVIVHIQYCRKDFIK